MALLQIMDRAPIRTGQEDLRGMIPFVTAASLRADGYRSARTAGCHDPTRLPDAAIKHE
jgi:hypothetical protein